MTIIPLYRYFRDDGGVTVSPIKPDGEYTQLSRLIADDGFVLTDGENFTPCVDTENIGMWSEVEFIEETEEATDKDYQEALAEFGVEL